MTNNKTPFRLVLAAAAALIAMPAASALALDGPAQMQSATYETKATSYIASRLVDSRGATYRMVGEPYMVSARLNNGQSYDCWAVDMKVRSDLSRTRGASTYTVLFHDGRAVALESDLEKSVVRASTGRRLAAN